MCAVYAALTCILSAFGRRDEVFKLLADQCKSLGAPTLFTEDR